jgi:hypothetical protein
LKSIAILSEIGDKKREAIALNSTGLLYDDLAEVPALMRAGRP